MSTDTSPPALSSVQIGKETDQTTDPADDPADAPADATADAVMTARSSGRMLQSTNIVLASLFASAGGVLWFFV